MLVVCSKDPLMLTAAGMGSAAAWGPRHVIPNTLSNSRANADLWQTLDGLGPQEELCLLAHGHDTSIGDIDPSLLISWKFTLTDIADYFEVFHANYSGIVLMPVCSTGVDSVAPKLAAKLEERGVARGTWVFGYDRVVGMYEAFPSPHQLHSFRAAGLQGTQVGAGVVSALRSRQ